MVEIAAPLSTVPTHDELDALIVRLLERSDGPRTARRILADVPKAMTVDLKRMGERLEALDGFRRIHEWPKLRKERTYWHCELEAKARELFVRVASIKPLGERDLFTAIRKLDPEVGPFIKQPLLKSIMSDALKSGKLFRHMPLKSSGSARYFYIAPDLSNEFTSPISAIIKKRKTILKKGFTEKQVSIGLSKALLPILDSAAPEELPADPAEKLYMIARLLPNVAVVSLPELRRVVGWTKREFDGAVLELKRNGRVVLHGKDDAFTLSDAQRDDLVPNGDGRFYVGMALKDQ